MSSTGVYITLEFTSNPNTLKYSANRQIVDRAGHNFTDMAKAKENSPLATRLLEVDGISGVMIGRDFVTVTKTEAGDWDLVHRSASTIIESHLNEGLPVLNENLTGDAPAVFENETPTEKKIREIFDQEFRPAVAMDGGDITFERFEAGVVYVYLQGSCSGCPSSTATLKNGIETRLKEVLPEVKEVVAV